MQTEALVAPVVQEIRVCGAFCRKPLLLSRFCHRKCKQLSVGVGAGWVSAGSQPAVSRFLGYALP